MVYLVFAELNFFVPILRWSLILKENTSRQQLPFRRDDQFIKNISNSAMIFFTLNRKKTK